MPDLTDQDLEQHVHSDAEEATGTNGDVEEQSESADPLADRPDLQKVLLDLYLECCSEDRYPRLIEVKDVKQAEFYWGGRQYIWWSDQDKQWNIPTQPTAQGWGDLNVDDMPRFEFVTNIYQARGLTVIGALAGAVPRYRFFPDDADNDDDIETAQGRTKLAKLIQRWNPPQLLMQEEGYHAWTGNVIAGWTRYVANGEKYGIDSVQLLSQGEEAPEGELVCPECGWSAPASQAEPPVPCPQCGHELTAENITDENSIPVPEDGETAEIPKGRQVISIFGALNFKRPQHTDQQSEWHYCAIEKEIHYSTLRAAYQDKASEIKPGMTFGADDVFERNARLSVAENTKLLTQTGAKQANLVTWASVWFRPTAWWMCKDEKQRNDLLEIFPRGARVEFGGTTYLISEPQSMDDNLVAKCVMPGRGQHRNGIGTAMLSVQDRYNTLSNISMETYEYGIPITYRASDTFAGEANDDQRAAPGLEVEVALQAGENIQGRIMQVRADSVSPDMQKYMGDLAGPVADTVSGTYPALTGSAAPGEQPETLGQQSMQRDQAMGRMGVFYVPIKQFHADLMTLATRDFQAHASGEVKIPVFGPSGDFESETVDVTALEGEAEAYPEGDENFPELWNQQRATFMQTMASPWGQEIMQEPGNAELGVKLLGIPDLKVPQLDAWHKQLREIAEMGKAAEADPLATVAPFVEVDPNNDDNPTEERCCGWWLNSDIGQKIKRTQPWWWQMVSDHRAKHKAAIPPPPPPEKPMSPSVTTAFKDMPPEAQAQYLEKEFGIKVDPQSFLQQVALEQAKKAPKAHPMNNNPSGPQGPMTPGVPNA